MVQISINGINREMTAEEKAEYVQIQADFEATKVQEKLNSIKVIRNLKLKETDWKVTSAKEQGSNLSTSFKNFRQALRDIPSTYTTESEYDELLARDDNGNLTHTVWSE